MTTAVGITALLAGSAHASISVTQGASGTTYTTTLNFDEAGGPVGDGLASDAFSSYGLASLESGDGNARVGNFDASTGGWGLGGNSNSFTGNFGVFMTFDSDLTSLSFQAWDPSGPPSPFGGGLQVFIFNDGAQIESHAANPAWGGIGDTWFDISADAGMVFDEVRVLGFGFDPTTYVDDISWNAVPTPGALATLGLSGVLCVRRRR